MAIFLTVVLVELLAADSPELNWTVLVTFAEQMGIGAAIGLGGAWALAWLINRINHLNAGLYPLMAFSGALLIFGATAIAGGSGYLAVYFAGILLSGLPLRNKDDIRRFHDGLAWLSQISMFLILGLLIAPHQLLPLVAPSLLIAAALILVARPIAVFLCLLPFRFAWREQLFIGWVGLRGAVPIILALFPWLANLDNYLLYFNIAFFIVLLSLVIQGWTVAPAARLLRLEVPPTVSSVGQRIPLDWPGPSGYELVSYRVTVDSLAAGRVLADLNLPETVRPAMVVREEQVVECGECGPLQTDDHVYLFAQAMDLPVLDQIFTVPHVPPRLQAGQFFGELALNANADLAEVACLYGLVLDPADAAGTLEQCLKRRFDRPVVGDRVRLGSVEFVVREMRGERIVKVGMKIVRSRGE